MSSSVASSSVTVRPCSMLVSPLPGVSLDCGPVGGLSLARFESTQPGRASHLIANRYTNIELYQIMWKKSQEEEDECENQLELRLQPIEESQPLFGCILQLALLPHSTPSGETIDFILVTSTSGFLSLLTYTTPNPGCPSRLTPLGHVRISHGSRGGLAVGRRTIGSMMRVERSGRAIAVASIEATKGDDKESASGYKQPPEGGMLVYPITLVTPSASSSSSSNSTPSLPDLQAPTAIPFEGTLTALTFLPNSSALSSSSSHVRLLVGSIPFPSPADDERNSSRATRSVRASVDQLRPASISQSTMKEATHEIPELTLIEVDLVGRTFRLKEFHLPLKPKDVIVDIILLNRATSHSHANQTATSSSSSSVVKSPCFVLIQLSDRVILADIDSQSPLLFPITLPIPPSSSPTPATSSSSMPSPSLTSWTWLEDRLIFANCDGDIYWLQFQLDRSHVASSSAPWLRWISLGCACTSSAVIAISTPPFVDEPEDELLSANVRRAPGHFLVLAGEQSDGMIVRIDWTGVEATIKQVDQTSHSTVPAGSSSSTLTTFSSSLSSNTSSEQQHLIVPLDSALHRMNQRLACLAILHDFVHVNAILPSSASSSSSRSLSHSSQIFAASGSGADGCIRVLRPGTITGELSIEEDEEQTHQQVTTTTTTERKVFHGLINLTLPPSSQSSDSSPHSIALLSSFFGSTRLSCLRSGALEDVSDEFAAFGFETERTTLNAAFSSRASDASSQRALIQVDSHTVRAIHVEVSGEDATTQILRASGHALTSWTPTITQPTIAAPSSSLSPMSSTHFTTAHILDDYVLVSLSFTRMAILLHYDPSSRSFNVVGEYSLPSDVSCLQLVRLSSKPNDLVCFIGTHDHCVHIVGAPIDYDAPMRAMTVKLESTTAPVNPQLRLLHTVHLDNPSVAGETESSTSSVIAESILVYSTLSSPSSSPTRFHVFIGLRDGSLLRCSYHPTALHTADVFRQPCRRHFGQAPLKLVKLSSTHLLALTDRPWVIHAALPASPNDSRAFRLYARELVWPWRSPVSTVIQFAAAFATPSSPSTIACVIEGKCYFAEIDPFQNEREVTHRMAIGATPRLLLFDETSNLLVVLTREDRITVRQNAMDGSMTTIPMSQLLLVDPSSGEIVDRYVFGSDPTSSSSSSSSSALPSTHEVGRSMAFWSHQSGNRYLMVGTGSSLPTATLPASSTVPTMGTVYGFLIQERKVAVDPSVAVPMDCSDAGTSSTPTSASAAVPTESSSSSSSSPSGKYHFQRAMILTDRATRQIRTFESGVLSIAPYSSKQLLFSIAGRMCMAYIHQGALLPMVITKGFASIPIRHLLVEPKSQLIVKLSDKFGVTFNKCIVEDKKFIFPSYECDPYSRLPRQALIAEAEVMLDYATNASLQSAATPLPLKHIQMKRLNSTTTDSADSQSNLSPGTTTVLRVIGFDAFGSVFVLRREPELHPTPASLNGTTTGAAPTVKVESSSASAVSSTSSQDTSKLLPPNSVPSGLVQESSFLLPSIPSRIRQVRSQPVRAMTRLKPSTATPASTSASTSTAAPMDTSSSSSSLSPLTSPISSSSATSPPLVDLVLNPSHVFLISSRLGSFHFVREVSASDRLWLSTLQTRLSVSPSTRSMLGNHHASFRGGGCFLSGDEQLMIDGELLATFFLLNTEQQQKMIDGIVDLTDQPLWRLNQYLHELLECRLI